MTIVLPALLCLTQQNFKSSSRSRTPTKTCVAEDKMSCNVIEESNIFCTPPAEPKSASATAEIQVEAETVLVRDGSTCETICSDSNADGTKSTGGNALETNAHVQQDENNIASADLATHSEAKTKSEEPKVLEEKTNSEESKVSEEKTNSEESELFDSSELYAFQVDRNAVRMMPTGPSSLLLQAFQEAATANGVEENYKRAQQGPSQLLTQALQLTAMSTRASKEQVEASPLSTTASSDGREEEIGIFEIDQEFEADDLEDESARQRDEHADEQEDDFEALLRDLGVPSDRGADEDTDLEDFEEDVDAAADYKSMLQNVHSDRGVTETIHEEDEDDEDWEVAKDMEQDEEDDEYAAFLEEMGVPPDWNMQRDDEEDEDWLTEEEEEL